MIYDFGGFGDLPSIYSVVPAGELTEEWGFGAIPDFEAKWQEAVDLEAAIVAMGGTLPPVPGFVAALKAAPNPNSSAPARSQALYWLKLTDQTMSTMTGTPAEDGTRGILAPQYDKYHQELTTAASATYDDLKRYLTPFRASRRSRTMSRRRRRSERRRPSASENAAEARQQAEQATREATSQKEAAAAQILQAEAQVKTVQAQKAVRAVTATKSSDSRCRLRCRLVAPPSWGWASSSSHLEAPNDFHQPRNVWRQHLVPRRHDGEPYSRRPGLHPGGVGHHWGRHLRGRQL